MFTDKSNQAKVIKQIYQDQKTKSEDLKLLQSLVETIPAKMRAWYAKCDQSLEIDVLNALFIKSLALRAQIGVTPAPDTLYGWQTFDAPKQTGFQVDPERYQSRPPWYRTMMHNRFYDKADLKGRERDNVIRGYDMSDLNED